jgi:hypothetical protein
MGERPTYTPPLPSLEVSKHRPSVKKSSNWSRKKSPILGICSHPSRYYNLINRQAGCALYLSPSQSNLAFLLPLAAVLGPLERLDADFDAFVIFAITAF